MKRRSFLLRCLGAICVAAVAPLSLAKAVPNQIVQRWYRVRVGSRESVHLLPGHYPFVEVDGGTLTAGEGVTIGTLTIKGNASCGSEIYFDRSYKACEYTFSHGIQPNVRTERGVASERFPA